MGSGRHIRAGLGVLHLLAARHVARGAAVLAIAYGASCRSGYRRDHWPAVSHDRDSAFDGHQGRRYRAAGSAGGGVLIFEVLLNAPSMFNHGNLQMPPGLDRILRLFVVTPDMHRVHHSVIPNETNSNFGFNMPWWDFLFGTCRSQPKDQDGLPARPLSLRPQVSGLKPHT